MIGLEEPVRLAAAQIPDLSRVLARAFYDDPPMEYVISDEANRREVLPHLMAVAVQFGHQYGEVYTTAGEPLGAAVWMPPQDVWPSQVRMMARMMASAALVGDAGLLGVPFTVGLTGIRRFLRLSDRFEELRKRDAPLRHWHLMILGVEPDRQGQGVGGSLIQPVLARADAEQVPCYLETAKARNVTFYQRHGFEVAVEDDITEGGPHFWTMMRAPRS